MSKESSEELPSDTTVPSNTTLFSVLNSRSRMKLNEKIEWLNQFTQLDLTNIGSTPSSKKLQEMQQLLTNSNKRRWDQTYTASKITNICNEAKERKRALQTSSTIRSQHSRTANNFLNRLISECDHHLYQACAENEQIEVRNRKRQEKTIKSITNPSLRPQDNIAWDDKKQEPKPCPLYRHYFTMATVNKDDINKFNQ